MDQPKPRQSAMTPRGAQNAKLELEESIKAQYIRELLSKNKLKIEYFPASQIRERLNFNQRNAIYGVTIDFNFLINIAKNEYLSSQQIQFYCNMFRSIYSTVKVGVAQCHFFSDFMPNSTEKLHDSILDPSFLGKDEKKDSQKSQIQNDSSKGQQNSMPQPEIPDQFQQNTPAPQFTHDLTATVEYKGQLNSKDNNSKKVEHVQNNKNLSQVQSKEQNVQKQLPTINQTQIKPKLEHNSNKQAYPQQSQSNNKGKTENQVVKNPADQNKGNVQEIPKSQQQNNTPQKPQTQVQQSQAQQIETVQQAQKQETQSQIQSQSKETQQPQQNVPPPQEIPQQPPQTQQPVVEKKWNFQITNVTVTKITPSQNKETFSLEKLDQLLTELAVHNNIDRAKLTQCDYLFFPINQNNYHWVSLIICFRQRIIHYFDSYYSTMNKDLVVSVEALLKTLNQNPKEYKTELHLNKQGNGYDCGIFVLLSLLYTFREQAYNYDQMVISEYRRRKLHNLAVIGSQVSLDKSLFEQIIDEK